MFSICSISTRSVSKNSPIQFICVLIVVLYNLKLKTRSGTTAILNWLPIVYDMRWLSFQFVLCCPFLWMRVKDPAPVVDFS